MDTLNEWQAEQARLEAVDELAKQEIETPRVENERLANVHRDRIDKFGVIIDSLALREWCLILTGILIVVVPWLCGVALICGY